jgi:hypothetical protein
MRESENRADSVAFDAGMNAAILRTPKSYFKSVPMS